MLLAARPSCWAQAAAAHEMPDEPQAPGEPQSREPDEPARQDDHQTAQADWLRVESVAQDDDAYDEPEPERE